MNGLSENLKNLKFMKQAEPDQINNKQKQASWGFNYQLPQTTYQQLMQNRNSNNSIEQKQCRMKFNSQDNDHDNDNDIIKE